MIRRIFLSQAALDDIDRLEAFLIGTSAAVRASEAISDGIESLADFSNRGHKGPGGLRELQVPFGRAAYIIQYDVSARSVFVARIFHSLEDRPLA